MFPSNSSMTWHPLPSPGSRWLRFPCFVGTTRCSDVLLSIPPRFVAFAWRYHESTRVLFPSPSSAPPVHNRGDSRNSQVPGEPLVPLPCSPTPAGPTRQAHAACRHGPRYVHGEGSRKNSSFRGSITRLWDSLFTLRPMQLPAPDAKLASGRWPSATRRDWLPAGFR
jgi:hypothetical protein